MIWVLHLKRNVLKIFLLTDLILVMLAVWLVDFINPVTRYRIDPALYKKPIHQTFLRAKAVTAFSAF